MRKSFVFSLTMVLTGVIGLAIAVLTGGRAVRGGNALASLAILIFGLLSFLNIFILKWRKRQGRDIQNEEKYEAEGGFITLHSNEHGGSSIAVNDEEKKAS